MDFWLLSGYTYLAILIFPHFCASTSLLLGVFLLLLHRREGPTLPQAGLAILASFVLGTIHPHKLLLADLLPFLYWGIRWKQTGYVPWRGVGTVVAMGLVQVPLLAYDLWIFQSRPVFAGWSAQNVTLSPPVYIYLLGYGVLLILTIIGIVLRVRKRDSIPVFSLLWIVLVIPLLYLPWNMQRRFLEGVQVPLGLLAGVGLAEELLPPRRAHRSFSWRRLALASIVALTTVSHLYLTAGLVMSAGTRSPFLFHASDVLQAIEWLEGHSAPQETVLAGFETGSMIPAYAGHRVVLGHWMETVDYEAKQEDVASFFQTSTSDTRRREMVDWWNVTFIFHGPEERQLGNFDPAGTPWLVPVFSNPQVTIYRVNEEVAP
jgi:hypothetical protein